MGQTRKKAKGGFSWNVLGPTKPMATCQCMETNTHACPNQPLENSLFCEKHQNCHGSPLSGSELPFTPELYNRDPKVYGVHNCLAYAYGVLDKESIQLCRKKGNCRQFFHQPGALSGLRNALNVSERRTCKMVEKLQKADNPDTVKTTFQARCPKGMSKIALVVDEGEDYHYYRQDSDGMWSHKDGSNKVKRFDALKRPIFNPELAARDYRWQGSDLNYDEFCGFYCVPRNRKVHLGRGGGTVRKALRRSQGRLSRRLYRRLSRRSRQSRRQSRRR
jgi:hypothetical protein